MNYKVLRRQGSEADKQALLRKLREDPEPKTIGWRIPAFATGFATVLGTAIMIGIFYTQAPIAAPEIDDLEFAGDSAVVIESDTDPATLIWLEDAEDVAEEEASEDEEF